MRLFVRNMLAMQPVLWHSKSFSVRGFHSAFVAITPLEIVENPSVQRGVMFAAR